MRNVSTSTGFFLFIATIATAGFMMSPHDVGAAEIVDGPDLTPRASVASKPTDACMRMDLELTWLIEEHGMAGDVADEILTQAAFSREAARKECQEGREAGGLTIYEQTSRSIVNDSLDGPWRSSQFHR